MRLFLDRTAAKVQRVDGSEGKGARVTQVRQDRASLKVEMAEARRSNWGVKLALGARLGGQRATHKCQ